MRRFPIDALKVDRSFVLNLSSNADDASVVSAVINMGKSLRMRVVAEGVETPEQVAFLKQHGCSEAQGNHFSHPLRADAVARFLRQSPKIGKIAPAGQLKAFSRRRQASP